MLKKIMQILLYVCLFAVTPGYGWKFEQNVVIEGVLERGQAWHSDICGGAWIHFLRWYTSTKSSGT